jgi:macrolide-specific efflux system membrane fusion protein
MKRASYIVAALIVALGLNLFAQTGSTSKSNKIVLENCLISAFDQAQVPGRDPAVLMSFNPNTSREGMEVSKGDLLAELDNADLLAKKESAEHEIEAAEAKAESDAELEVAKATKAVSEQEVEGALQANKKSPGTVPLNELRRLRLQVERYSQEIRLREMERGVHAHEAKIKRAQLKSVEVELDRRQIKAPLDGVIVERLKHEGEWVQPGDTILKVVRLDRLRVEGFVPAEQYSPQDIAGAKVTVSVEVPGKNGEKVIEKATGTIEFVSPVVEASGEYRVWTEIENRKSDKHWVFRPGTVATMEVTLKSGGATTRPVSTKLGK